MLILADAVLCFVAQETSCVRQCGTGLGQMLTEQHGAPLIRYIYHYCSQSCSSCREAYADNQRVCVALLTELLPAMVQAAGAMGRFDIDRGAGGSFTASARAPWDACLWHAGPLQRGFVKRHSRHRKGTVAQTHWIRKPCDSAARCNRG